ncbi:SusC/RagA family TonB-linked outer membrane protein [candidate division KSB1 bacterium]|nr:SusC/RagA family TonB-linked outer membrane protein [candidate division KSB1 bacterium]
MKSFTRVFSLILVAFALHGVNVTAQELAISGTVVSQASGEYLPGANIVVKGTQLGTTTDFNGSFRLLLTGMNQATLVVSFIGYKTEEIQVTSSSQSLTVELEEDVLRLSEIVVTGLATSVARRNLANAVATVNAAELVPAPAQTLDRALSGKFAGVTVSQNTGAPGGGIYVDLRGVSTIEGSTQPLYVVDGVIVNNAATQSGIDLVTKATAAGSATPQGQPPNRIADINPNDIDNIEVLKGASAAAIYGAKASNGVVIINTKRGYAGRPRIDVTQQIGFSSILNKLGTRKFTAQTAEETNGASGRQQFEQNGGRFIDQEEVLYGETGRLAETTVSLRGGSENTQFFVSGLLQDENGIVKKTGYQKYSGKVNVSHRFSPRLSVDVFSNFLRSESNRGITGNDNSFTTFGFVLGFTPSYVDLRPQNGVYPDGFFSNPLHSRDALINEETVYRTINSARLNYNFFRTARQGLDFIAQAGFDFYSQFNQVFSPPELQFERDSDQPGTSLDGETRSTNSNLYLNLAYSYNTSSSIDFRTSAGVQFENQDLNNVLTQARGLNLGQTNIDQGANLTAFQTITKQFDRGFYLQQEVDLKQKIYLTASVRGDASSSHGDTDKYFFYPKASASVRLSQLNFWKGLSSFSDEFKLRLAYGETGNSPPPNAKFTTYVPVNIDGRSGLIVIARRGNAGIKPERTKEIETGFDASLFGGKAGLEFTYYRQNISDLILISQLPQSSGFEEEFSNAGKMRTQGIEIGLAFNPLRKRNLRWSSRINFYKTSSKITQLDVDPFNKGGFATSLGTYRIEEGKSPTTIIGLGVADSAGNAPVVEFGDETPDFELSFNNGIALGNVELNFLWHWKQGGEVINLGRFITDLGGTTEDYDRVKVQLSTGGFTTKRLRGDFGTGAWIEDGTYLKLREVSLSYTFPRTAVASWFGSSISNLKVGVAGRNLLMFTDYTGYDPEVSQFGSIAIGRSVDTIPYPSSRSFYFNLAFGF